MKFFDDFFVSYRRGNCTGYACFHEDRNMMYKDMKCDVSLIKSNYDILTVNNKGVDLSPPAAGERYPAEYSMMSGLIIPWNHMVWEFKRIFDEDMIAEWKTVYDESKEQFENTYKYVFIYIPDARNGWSSRRFFGKVIGHDGDILKTIIISKTDIPVSGIECHIDRANDNCRVETILGQRYLSVAKDLDTNDVCGASIMSMDDLTEFINIKQRAHRNK